MTTLFVMAFCLVWLFLGFCIGSTVTYRGDFYLGLHHPAVARAIHAAKKWWQPYGPETAADKVEALTDACAYWEMAHRLAIEERDAALERLAALGDKNEAS